MNFNSFLPQTYQNLTNQQYYTQPMEKLSSLLGQTFQLASIDNLNILPIPRMGEMQIILTNNEEKIYGRSADNSLSIIGYKYDYVQNVLSELKQAQEQLHEIFLTVASDSDQESDIQKQANEPLDALNSRIDNLENMLNNLIDTFKNNEKGVVTKNESSGNDKALAAISELA